MSPVSIMSPLSVCGRVGGWGQRASGNNMLFQFPTPQASCWHWGHGRAPGAVLALRKGNGDRMWRRGTPLDAGECEGAEEW